MSDDVLVDTHIAIRFLEGNPRTVALLGDVLDDEASTITLSAVTTFEIAIKHSIGKLRLDVDEARERLLEIGWLELPISSNHASAFQTLPIHHRDPFDRMLIAQAMAEDMTLVTADRQFAAYRDVVRLRGV